jgi:hypothetical protein
MDPEQANRRIFYYNLSIFLIYLPLYIFVLFKLKFKVKLYSNIVLGSYLSAFTAKAFADGIHVYFKDDISEDLYDLIQLIEVVSWSACIGFTYFFVMNIGLLKIKL